MLYLVTYDLNKPEQNYSGLFEFLKSNKNWWHHLDSTWLIKSDEEIEIFKNKVKAQIDDNDSLLIINVTDDKYKGWLTKKAWDWLRNNING